MRYDTRPALDSRSVIIAIVVLLLGAGLGFGVGYKYEQHSSASKSHTSASSNSPTTSANNAANSAAAKLNAVLVACMAKQGVKYPSPSSDLSKPPAVVSAATYTTARAACAKALLKR